MDPRQGSLSLSCSLNSYIVGGQSTSDSLPITVEVKARFLDHDRRDDTTSTSVSSVSETVYRTS